MEEKVTAGFNKPRSSEPGWASKVKAKYGFTPGASLEEMEAKATELLGDPRTALEGAD